jgi:predicted nuclease of predicted toxin-antitoxin system
VKILLDTCVWGGARASLEAAGHQVDWTGSWSKDPGDEEILKHASTNQQILITLDKDFGELAIVRGVAHHGIVRLVGIRAQEQGPLAVSVIERYAAELAMSAVLTVESWRVRVKTREP